MKVQIKLGASIGQDRTFGEWPRCAPPMSEYLYKEYQYVARNPQMVFDADWVDGFSSGHWKCIAPGYGEKGKYGNGAIYVHERDGVIEIPQIDERNVALAKLQEIAEVVEWRNCELSKRIREILKDG